MYAKIAINNAKRSIKDYLIYFVTLILCVSLFYGFTSLSSSDYKLITEDSYNLEMLKQILKYSTYIVTSLLVILIGYVNKYMIKRRKREFATYILLGAPQKTVAFMFFIEMLVVGIISIFIGIFIGTLFSQLVTALVLITAKQEIIFSFKIYVDTVIITFIFFIAMFCIIGVFNIKSLTKIKIIDMINDEKKTEFQFKRSNIVYISIFIISILFYIICGYCSYKILQAMSDITIIRGTKVSCALVAIITFVIGTYALFYSLAYIIVVIKEKWTSFKYEYTNLFLIGSIVSKIKTAPILMATISLTFLGAALSFTLTLLMAQWGEGFLDYRLPFDINISNSYIHITEIKDIPKIDYSDLASYFSNEKYGLKDYCQVEKYFIKDTDFYKGRNKENPYESKSMPALAIGLSDYNNLRRMLGYNEITLGDNEFTTQWEKIDDDIYINDNINNNSTIDVNGTKLNISSNPYYKETIGEYIYNMGTGTLIILPDDICKTLVLAETDFFGNTKSKMSCDEAVKLRKEYVPNWFEENYRGVCTKYGDNISSRNESIYPGSIRIKVGEASEILNSTLSMRILGIYLGTVLLMISLTVLALQQLSDSIEHKERFKTLKKLGIDNKEINKLILKQISLYFIMPIAIAVIGFLIFLYNYTKIFKNEINIYIGDKAFIFNVVISLGLILTIYICYFVATYYTFKRNIENKSGS